MSRKSGSFSNLMARKTEAYLPLYTKPRSKFRVSDLLSHCLYRRVVVWTVIVVAFLTLSLFDTRLAGKSRTVLNLVHGSKGQARIPKPVQENILTKHPSDSPKEVIIHDEEIEQQIVVVNSEEHDKTPTEDDPTDPHEPVWLQFPHLDGYYTGLRSLVPFSEYKPEYPKQSASTKQPNTPTSVHHLQLPTQTVYDPYPEYESGEYQDDYVPVKPCYLDADGKIPTPKTYAYNGLPQGQPKPVIGSHSLLGIREDVCFDRFGRYGPYGLGYGMEEGGTGEATDTENESAEIVWEKTGKINYDEVDWAVAQDRCFDSNKDRFFTGNATRDEELVATSPKKINRTAVVIRTYVGFKWTAFAVLNFRAMISELNLRSGGEYDVHFLLHVRDNGSPIWADPDTAQYILEANVPPEFHGLCTLWSEAQMALYYPGNFGNTFENPSGQDIHGVYRSAHMPLQHFANTHPEYSHFWNWEMDMRYTGSYYELFDRLSKWANKQSRRGLWERSAKYYIPDYHGSWDNFTKTVERETSKAGKTPVMGSVVFGGKINLEGGEEYMPPSCHITDLAKCGVGEEADLITLNPLFDADESGWVFASDVTGYDTNLEKPPRRSSIVTASRLSRRLLNVMHEETWRMHHSMFSEMFPPSMAFHHGLKAVFAPHPLFLDREWPIEQIDAAFNGGRDRTAGGHGSPFDLDNEHNHKGTSWYYNSEFAGLLWRRWLGYAQMDGRGDNGGRAGEGTLRGGAEEESDPDKSGRLCMRSMLVHPIKWEHPAEQDL